MKAIQEWQSDSYYENNKESEQWNEKVKAKSKVNDRIKVIKGIIE